MTLSSGLFALALAAADSTAPADTAPVPPSRVVRRLETILVRASPLPDVLSSQSIVRLSRAELGALPIDRLREAIALKAGVVAHGEDLHVRGGRTGETQVLVHGIPLAEPLRGRPMELPLLAVESADLVTGGLDAEHGGALAGVLPVRTVEWQDRPEAEIRSKSDGWLGDLFFDPHGYDEVSGRLSAPLFGGLGLVAAAEARMDDTHLPALRSRRSSRSWRADNDLLGFAKLSGRAPSRWALEVLASRQVDRPFDLMWSLDGYTVPTSGPFGADGPAYSPVPLPGFERYRAADHAVMTDERRLAAVLSAARGLGPGLLSAALAWQEARRLTSVDGRDDESYLDVSREPRFGRPGSSVNDPILVYWGDEPFYQRSTGRTLSLRADWGRLWERGDRVGAGAGALYEEVEMRELDLTTRNLFLDSLRAYHAFAPGGFAYLQGRRIWEGLVLNGGLRLEAFTAGPQAERQSYGAPARTHWSLSPRLGISYPVSTRDVLSLSYVRIQQNPARDFLYENRRRISFRQPLGNPALEPATVISYQAALKHLFEQGRALQVSVFFRDLFGLVGARAFDLGPGADPPRYENADKGHAEGFELGLTIPAGPDRGLDLQYTFLHAVGSQSLEEGVPFGGTQTARTEAVTEQPLDWDRRHTLAVSGRWRLLSRAPDRPPRGPLELVLRALRGEASVSWTTLVGSPLPWTPSPRRELLVDPSLVNSRRLDWLEQTALALRWRPALLGRRLAVGLDVRNLFDTRGERAATLYGYPHPFINTMFDDYGAHRDETGQAGGGYWDSPDPEVADAWVAVRDPRLFEPPRRIRFSLTATL